MNPYLSNNIASSKEKADRETSDQIRGKAVVLGTFEDMVGLLLKGADEVVKKREMVKKK